MSLGASVHPQLEGGRGREIKGGGERAREPFEQAQTSPVLKVALQSHEWASQKHLNHNATNGSLERRGLEIKILGFHSPRGSGDSLPSHLSPKDDKVLYGQDKPCLHLVLTGQVCLVSVPQPLTQKGDLVLTNQDL